MKLRPSDPASTDRLAAFFEDLGHEAAAAGDVVVLAEEIPEGELAVYLRVWGVLEPDVTVTVEP